MEKDWGRAGDDPSRSRKGDISCDPRTMMLFSALWGHKIKSGHLFACPTWRKKCRAVRGTFAHSHTLGKTIRNFTMGAESLQISIPHLGEWEIRTTISSPIRQNDHFIYIYILIYQEMLDMYPIISHIALNIPSKYRQIL